MTTQTQEKTVLVTGATGNQGGAVVEQLLKAGGWRVRALTRDPGSEKARALAARGVEVVQGDMDAPNSLDRALEGAYGAFSVQSRAFGIETEVQHGINMADAAKRAGLPHLVYTSVCTADRRTGVPHFESKGAIEKYIWALEIPHTIIRPVSFMENFRRNRDAILGGGFSGPRAPDARNQYVAVRDIGAFTVAALSRPEEFMGLAVDIAGDELTQEGVAEAFSKALDRPVRYTQTTHEPGRGAPDQQAMNRLFDRGGYDVDIPSLRSRWGIPLATLEEWVPTEGWV